MNDYNKQLDELSIMLDEWIEQHWRNEKIIRVFRETGILVSRPSFYAEYHAEYRITMAQPSGVICLINPEP